MPNLRARVSLLPSIWAILRAGGCISTLPDRQPMLSGSFGTVLLTELVSRLS